MIPASTYRGATIEGFYDPEFGEEGHPAKQRYKASVTHVWLQGVWSYAGESWQEALDAATDAIDEWLNSLN